MNSGSFSCVEEAKPGELYQYSPRGTLYFVISNTEKKWPLLPKAREWRTVLFLGNGSILTHECYGDRSDEYWVPVVDIAEKQ